MLFKKDVQDTLKPSSWKKVNQKLQAKMLSEYMYEDMIHPEVVANRAEELVYELTISPKKKYRFQAARRLFDSYDVRGQTIQVMDEAGIRDASSAIELLTDLQEWINMSSETTGHLIKELNATLIADAHHQERTAKSSDELIQLDYAELEGFMKGHPWITYNKGRIGFGYDDYLAYAPEKQEEIRLCWVAVHRSYAEFRSVAGLNYPDLINQELSQQEQNRFANEVQEAGKDPAKYYFLPVHEWQWKNILILNFPEELATNILIPLGQGDDIYLPQQSIRTFVNRSAVKKHHVKLPMSILNTLVYRGLPAERTIAAPRVTELIKGIFEQDSFLKEECRAIMPGENASINVDQTHFTQVKNAPYQYHEMLGTIWRESIYTYLEEGEQAITLAALIHKDHNDKPYVTSLINSSGLETEEWISQLFEVVMDPLLHYLYQYGIVFSPHGQNTILVLKDGKPHRLAIKDFVDDVNITDQAFPELGELPYDLKCVLRSEPPEGLTQFIFTGLFVCHLRYLSHILINHHYLSEEKFWSLLAESILNYQKRFPHLNERFELFNFFKPEMTKLCLNRNRMVDYGYEDGDDRPHASEYGKVKNPLFLFKEKVYF